MNSQGFQKAQTSRVKDRFKELSKIQNPESSTTIDVNQQDEASPKFQQVFDKVYNIRNWIGNIKENTIKIKQIIQSEECFASQSKYNKIELLVKDTYDIAFKITNELKELDVKDSKKTVLVRMKKIQYGSLRQDFQNAIFENNEVLEKYREQKRAILVKQALLVNANIEDDEMEELLNTSDSVHLFTDNILLNTRVAKEELNQIEERYSELRRIEDMLQEVNGQFKQIAILVEQQKEHINRIEFHACDATNYVDKGTDDIQRAKKHKKKTRKRLYIIIACVAVFLIILILLLR